MTSRFHHTFGWGLGVLSLWAACSAQAQDNTQIPVISCASPPSIFNTGVSDAGAQLTPVSQDPQWFLARTTQSATPNPDLAPPASGWAPTWVPANPLPSSFVQTRGLGAVFTDADWVSGAANATSTGTGGNIPDLQQFFRTQFDLAPEVPASAVSFTLNYQSDDETNRVFVNGTAQTLTPPSVALSGPFLPGQRNAIVFSVRDYGWVAGLVVRADPSVRSICSVSPIRIGKTVDQPSYQTGDTVNYHVTVTSLGALPATGVSINDPVPSGLVNPQWSCAASGGAVCPAAPIAAPINFDLAAGGELVFTLTGTAGATGTLDNTATLNPGTGGVCAADTGCTATVAPTLIGGGQPQAVPTLEAWLLGVLAAAMGGAGALVTRRARKD